MWPAGKVFTEKPKVYFFTFQRMFLWISFESFGIWKILSSNFMSHDFFLKTVGNCFQIKPYKFLVEFIRVFWNFSFQRIFIRFQFDLVTGFWRLLWIFFLVGQKVVWNSVIKKVLWKFFKGLIELTILCILSNIFFEYIVKYGTQNSVDVCKQKQNQVKVNII